MKLKTVFAASLLVGGVAFAEDITTGYTVGVLPLTLTSKETVICVPWIESGQTSEGVAVANFIKTAGLPINTELYWYDPNNQLQYRWWKIEVENGPWVACDGTYGQIDPKLKTLNRGDAVILVLPDAASYNQTVYVVGQCASGDATTTIAAGTKAAPAYTLMAPPFTSTIGNTPGKISLNNDAIDWTQYVSADDEIIVGIKYITIEGTPIGIPDKYVWGTDSSDSTLVGWGKYSGMTFTYGAEVSVGRGFWYKRCGNVFSVTWRH